MRAYLPPLLWMLLIFAVSNMSNPPGQGGGDARAYAAHFTEYAILTLLLARVIGIRAPGWHLAVIALAAATIGVCFGLSDEWHQSFVSGRDASLLDASFDAMGAVVGATVWTVAAALRRGGFSSRSV